MTDDICARLAEPFNSSVVSWRVGPTTKDKTKGMALAYIDARDVMRRLDEVCGPENWQDDYPWSDGKRVVCRIGIKIGDEWIWKTDGAGDTDTEGEKGALSDAFKRSAVKWGIGRYLYDVTSPWVQIEQKGNSYVIAESEYARLRTMLPGGRDDPAMRVTQPKPPNPDRDRCIAAKDRIKQAIEGAREPRGIDNIIQSNAMDIEFIKGFHPPTYDALMSLAAVRKTEMVAAA